MSKIFTIAITLFGVASCNTRPAEQILFSSSIAGNSDIYIMNADGSDKRQITTSSLEEWGPVWISSQEISFLRQEDSGIARISLNLKTGIEKEIDHPAECILDDKNMVYSSTGGQGLFVCNGNIFLWNGSSSKSITEGLEGVANYPAWISGGNKITFTSNHEGSNNVYAFDLESVELVNLTKSDANDERGDVSRDGNYLVFSSDRFEKGNQDILLLDLSSGKLEKLVESPGMELIARWSSDGGSVYFGSNKDGNWEIYAYSLNTKKTTRLTSNEAFDGDPRVY